jgi:hypothetical protein
MKNKMKKMHHLSLKMNMMIMEKKKDSTSLTYPSLSTPMTS